MKFSSPEGMTELAESGVRERDNREVWDEDDAIQALGEAIRIVVDGITVLQHPARP